MIFAFKLVSVWDSTAPFFSVAIPIQKKSPYYPALRKAILKRIENGQLEIITSRYLSSGPSCGSHWQKGKALGLKKLVFLFFIVTAGLTLALIILAGECLSKKFIKVEEQEEPEVIISGFVNVIASRLVPYLGERKARHLLKNMTVRQAISLNPA